MRRPLPLDDDGALLRAVALGHVAVGVVFYRRELRSIARGGVVAGVPNRGSKATAFWFLVPSSPIWIAGRLISRAQETGDREALRGAHGVGLASAVVALICMPISGFWAWLAISARGLWRSRNTGG